MTGIFRSESRKMTVLAGFFFVVPCRVGPKAYGGTHRCPPHPSVPRSNTLSQSNMLCLRSTLLRPAVSRSASLRLVATRRAPWSVDATNSDSPCLVVRRCGPFDSPCPVVYRCGPLNPQLPAVASRARPAFPFPMHGEHSRCRCGTVRALRDVFPAFFRTFARLRITES